MGVSNTCTVKAHQQKKRQNEKKNRSIAKKRNTNGIVCTDRTSILFTSCSTSIGISRTPLFNGELNGLWDRLGDNERSTDDGNRGPMLDDPLLLLFAVSGSGLNGISTIGLGDRCVFKSFCCCARNTLCIGHGAFFDMISIFVIESNQIESNPASITKLNANF